jgi:hypothetical protein
MSKFARRTMASAFASAALMTAVALPSQAQEQDGLINVAVGDITIQDINVGVAAQIAANACNIQVGPVAVLGRAVDRTGVERTVCETDQGDVVLRQN